MRRLIGFVLFWIAVGMALMMFLHSQLLGVIIIFLLLVLGYNMFTC